MGSRVTFVKKEFFHILRDKRTMLILIIMPIVEIILFGFAISVEIQGINIAVVTSDMGETVRKIEEKIDANPYFKIAGTFYSQDEALKMMRVGKIDMILRFPSGLDRKILSSNHERKSVLSASPVRIIVDASNPNTAVTEQMYLKNVLMSCFSGEGAVAAYGITSGISFETSAVTPEETVRGTSAVASSGTASGMIGGTPAGTSGVASIGHEGNVVPDIRLMYNPGMQSSYNFVPGIMGMIMIIICAMMTSVSIVREKENGTMEVLLVSPVKPLTVIISKMIPYFVISSINLAVILLLAKFVLAVPLSGSLFWTCAISMVYIILSLALGMLISTLVKTQAAAMLSSAMLLLLPVIMLSGMIFPIESEPHFFQWISMTVPARWYISAMRKLMVEGQQLSAVLPELGILSGMAVLLISVALFNLKSRLE